MSREKRGMGKASFSRGVVSERLIEFTTTRTIRLFGCAIYVKIEFQEFREIFYVNSITVKYLVILGLFQRRRCCIEKFLSSRHEDITYFKLFRYIRDNLSDEVESNRR